MTPLEAAQSKIANGNFDLTVAEMTALAKASAASNPVMIPIKREHAATERPQRHADTPTNSFDPYAVLEPAKREKTGPGKPRMIPDLIEQIMDICAAQDRNDARQRLAQLFETKGVQVITEKTWSSEADYKHIGY